MVRQIKITEPFNLELSLTMGQAFRWVRLGDGWYSGVLGENLVHIRQTDWGVEYRVGGPEGERHDVGFDWDVEICRYFRMDTDNIRGIYDDLCRDQRVAMMIWRYMGLRLLRQEPWECLVTYLSSRANSIENMRHNAETIAELSGRTVSMGDDERYLFPTAAELRETEERTLSQLPLMGLRYPGRAMLSAAQLVVAGDLHLDELKEYGHSYETVIGELRKVNGVGYKIANCVALFGLNRVEAFPCDRWVNRALAEYYDDFPMPARPESPNDREHREIAEWSQQRFGPFAGYAGQYLFHGRRQEEATSRLPFFKQRDRSFTVIPHHDDPRWVALARKHLS